MKNSTVCGMAFAIFLSVPGCGESISNSTPQSVSEEFTNAAEREDWSAAFQHLTAESQEMLLMPLTIYVASQGMDRSGKADEIVALFEKHGYDIKDNNAGYKNVPDKGAMFGDFIAWVKKNAADTNKWKAFTEFVDRKIANIEINGRTATADCGGRSIAFRAIGDRWYIDFFPIASSQ